MLLSKTLEILSNNIAELQKSFNKTFTRLNKNILYGQLIIIHELLFQLARLYGQDEPGWQKIFDGFPRDTENTKLISYIETEDSNDEGNHHHKQLIYRTDLDTFDFNELISQIEINFIALTPTQVQNIFDLFENAKIRLGNLLLLKDTSKLFKGNIEYHRTANKVPIEIDLDIILLNLSSIYDQYRQGDCLSLETMFSSYSQLTMTRAEKETLQNKQVIISQTIKTIQSLKPNESKAYNKIVAKILKNLAMANKNFKCKLEMDNVKPLSIEITLHLLRALFESYETLTEIKTIIRRKHISVTEYHYKSLLDILGSFFIEQLHLQKSTNVTIMLANIRQCVFRTNKHCLEICELLRQFTVTDDASLYYESEHTVIEPKANELIKHILLYRQFEAYDIYLHFHYGEQIKDFCLQLFLELRETYESMYPEKLAELSQYLSNYFDNDSRFIIAVNSHTASMTSAGSINH